MFVLSCNIGWRLNILSHRLSLIVSLIVSCFRLSLSHTHTQKKDDDDSTVLDDAKNGEKKDGDSTVLEKKNDDEKNDESIMQVDGASKVLEKKKDDGTRPDSNHNGVDDVSAQCAEKASYLQEQRDKLLSKLKTETDVNKRQFIEKHLKSNKAKSEKLQTYIRLHHLQGLEKAFGIKINKNNGTNETTSSVVNDSSLPEDTVIEDDVEYVTKKSEKEDGVVDHGTGDDDDDGTEENEFVWDGDEDNASSILLDLKTSGGASTVLNDDTRPDSNHDEDADSNHDEDEYVNEQHEKTSAWFQAKIHKARADLNTDPNNSKKKVL